MGIGHFNINTGTFDLIVSFEFAASPNQLDEWADGFAAVSQLLSDATDGAMKIGTVRFVNASVVGGTTVTFGKYEQDIRIAGPPPPSVANSSFDKLFTESEFLRVSQEKSGIPLTVLHELAHYAFNLQEEYAATPDGPPDGATCTGDDTTGACIMEFTGSNHPTVYQFCTAATPHVQNGHLQVNPCWVDIAAHPKFGNPPIPTYPPDPYVPVDNPPAVGWEALEPVRRISLVLDRSGSMEGLPLDGVKDAAQAWIEEVKSNTGDSLSVVAFDDTLINVLDQVVLGTASDAAVDAAKVAVGMLTDGNSTDIGGALVEGVTQILKLPDPTLPARAVTQVILLVSDGHHNVGLDPLDAVTQAVAAGTRVFTVAIGPNADQPLLATVATSTVGQPKVASTAYLDIKSQMSQVMSDISSGLIASRAATLPVPGDDEAAVGRGYGAKALDLARELPITQAVSPIGFELPAMIEQGARRASFLLIHDKGTQAYLYLYDPAGNLVDPYGSEVDHFADDTDVYFQTRYTVLDPAPGEWRAQVARGGSSGPIALEVLCWASNDSLNVSAHPNAFRLEVGDILEIDATAWFPGRLTQLPPPELLLAGSEPGVEAPPPLERLTVFRESPPASGRYRADHRFTDAGTYRLMVRVRNDGTAVQVGADLGDETPPAPLGTVPPFFRLKPLTVVVTGD